MINPCLATFKTYPKNQRKIVRIVKKKSSSFTSLIISTQMPPKTYVNLRDQLVGLEDKIKKLDSEVKSATDAITNHKKNFRSMLVSQSGNKRMVRILPRGNWLDKSGEVVDPAIPEFMGKLELEDRKANRLDLAKWVVSKDNPLPARAFTNRIWKIFLDMDYPVDLKT